MSSQDQTLAKVSPSVRKEVQDRKLKPPPPDHHSKCPRCESPNTKFCYYNNYSLSQPRHFCKTCRRYWTKGGALRNVPIGGGCRKNKKMKQRLVGGISHSRDSSSCEIMGSSSGGGLNFFQGFLTPAMDFQLGSINPTPSTTSNSMFPISGTDANLNLYDHHYHDTSEINPNNHSIISSAVPTLVGFDYVRSSQSGGGGDHHHHGGLHMGITSSNNSMIVHSNLASSIESLSSINQELHWKLQQQRLAVLFSGGSGDQSEKLHTDDHQSNMAHVEEYQFVDHHEQQHRQQISHQTHKLHQLQPILFQNLETGKDQADPFSTIESRIEDHPEAATRKLRMEDQNNNAGGATEWFFDNARNNNNNINNNENLNNDEDSNNDQNNHSWNSGGIQLAWSNMQQQYDGALP